jgi:hypothetical protein
LSAITDSSLTILLRHQYNTLIGFIYFGHLHDLQRFVETKSKQTAHERQSHSAFEKRPLSRCKAVLYGCFFIVMHDVFNAIKHEAEAVLTCCMSPSSCATPQPTQ